MAALIYTLKHDGERCCYRICACLTMNNSIFILVEASITFLLYKRWGEGGGCFKFNEQYKTHKT